MGSDELKDYEARFVELEHELNTFIQQKTVNESRWSWVASGGLVLSPALGGLSAALVIADVPTGLAAASAIVTGLSSVLTRHLPDDKKRIGNKVLAAKAEDLLHRVRDRADELGLEETTPYALLRRLRYEGNVLKATSSAAAAIQPFWEIPPAQD